MRVGWRFGVVISDFVLSLDAIRHRVYLQSLSKSCLSLVGERASVDIEQYSDACERLAVEMQSAGVAYFLCG